MASTCRTGTTAATTSSGAKKKRSHKSLTLNAKLEMIKLSEHGLSMAEISRRLGVPRPTVSTVVNAKEKVLKEVRSATPLNTTVIRKRDGLIADMEKRLLVSIEDQTNHSIPVSQAIIQDKALSIFNFMKAERGKAAAEDKFSASRGWFSRFKKRSSLHTNVQDGAIGDDSHTIAAGGYPREFYKVIEDCGYANQQIFPVNETAFKKPSKTYFIKENSVPGMKAAKGRLMLKDTDNFEDFENPEEEDITNVAEMAREFEVKVEQEDEAEMICNDETLANGHTGKERSMLCEKESHSDSNADIHRLIAIKELEEAISCIETGMAAFERLDPNFERSSEVNASILSSISCYQEMLKKKRKFVKHSSSVCKFEKAPVHQCLATGSLEMSSVSVAKQTTARNLSKSSPSK